MASAAHRTVGTSAPTGGFTFFLILHELDDNEREDKGKHKANNNGG